MNDLDILICIIPKISPDAPTIGPSLLKSHLSAAGFTCDVVDLNIKLFNSLKEKGEHEKYYFDDDSIFRTTHQDLDDTNTEFENFCTDYQHVLSSWVDLFKQKNPKWIGLSVFSSFSQSMAVKISQLIREHLPDVKIVWGGPQIETGIDKFKDKGFLDHYICGDAENSIVELLQGNMTANGINKLTPNQVDLNQSMIPNYDDIDWAEYVSNGHDNIIYVTGSRGCVKKCTFCNVYQIWPEYRFRSGKNIMKEIKVLKEKYGRNEFRFTDSLINGSMKSFREMMHELIEYKKTNRRVTWKSQWIVRPKNQSPEEDFRLMKESGCVEVDIGVESFSESVRYHMGKKFTNEDMWWCFDMLTKYKIPYGLLMIVGYPTETEEDHQITLDTIRRLFRDGYATSKTEYGSDLLYLGFGNTLMLSDNMPLWDQIKDDLTYYHNEFDWDYRGNDLLTRLRRYKEVHQLIQELNNGVSGGWLYRKSLRMYEEALEKAKK